MWQVIKWFVGGLLLVPLYGLYCIGVLAEWAGEHVHEWAFESDMPKLGMSEPYDLDDEEARPYAVTMYCPACGTRHIDEGEWETRPHRTHRCAKCGQVWQPFSYYTRGV